MSLTRQRRWRLPRLRMRQAATLFAAFCVLFVLAHGQACPQPRQPQTTTLASNIDDPGRICTADFTGYGPQDVVIGSTDEPTLQFLINQGIDFATPYPINDGETGFTSISMVLCQDVNGDTMPDVVVSALDGSERIVAYVNQGFHPAPPFSTKQRLVVQSATDTQTYMITACDVNHDGFLDLLSMNRGGSVASVLYWENTTPFPPSLGGAASFAASTEVVPNLDRGRSIQLKCLDINSDTHPDAVFVAGTVSNSQMMYALGDGTGTFGAATLIYTEPTDQKIHDFAVGPMSSNVTGGVSIALLLDPDVRVIPSLSAGTVPTWGAPVFLGAVSNTPVDGYGIAVGQMSSLISDQLDIILLAPRSNTLYLIANLGGYRFDDPVVLSESAFNARDVVLGTVLAPPAGVPRSYNSLDVLMSVRQTNSIEFLYGNVYDPRHVVGIWNRLSNAGYLDAADINSDGLLDVVINQGSLGWSSFVLNGGDSEIGSPIYIGQTLVDPLAETYEPSHPRLAISHYADLTGNALNDAIGTQSLPGSTLSPISPYSDATGIVWSINMGAEFPPSHTFATSSPAIYNISDFVLVDVNNDNRLDIVYLRSLPDGVPSGPAGVLGWIPNRLRDLVDTLDAYTIADYADMFRASDATPWLSGDQLSHSCNALTGVSNPSGLRNALALPMHVAALCRVAPSNLALVASWRLDQTTQALVNPLNWTFPLLDPQGIYLRDMDALGDLPTDGIIDLDLDLWVVNQTVIAAYENRRNASGGPPMVFDTASPVFWRSDYIDSISVPMGLTFFDANVDGLLDVLPTATIPLLGTGETYLTVILNKGRQPTQSYESVFVMYGGNSASRNTFVDITNSGVPDAVFVDKERVGIVPAVTVFLKGQVFTKDIHVDIAYCGYTVACLYRAMGQTSACSTDVVRIPPGTYTGCPTWGLLPVRRSMTLLAVAGPGSVVIDCEGNGGLFFVENPPPSVVSGVTVTTLVVDGITFRGLTAVEKSEDGASGIHVSGETTVFEVRNSRFENCSSAVRPNAVTQTNQGMGGAVLVDRGATFTASHTVFADNQAGVHGGAVAILDAAQTVSLSDVAFSGNTALGGSGGGLYVEAQDAGTVRLSVVNTTWDHNHALVGDGGGLALVAPIASSRVLASLDDVAIRHCRASLGAGGGVSVAGAHVELNATFTALQGCSAHWGGAMATVDSTGVVPTVEGPSAVPPTAFALGRSGLAGVATTHLAVELKEDTTGHQATYGGFALVCGTSASVAASSGPVTLDSHASVAGGVEFACIPSSPAPAPASEAVSLSGITADATTSGYGVRVATPPVSSHWVTATSSIAQSSSPASPLALVTGDVIVWDSPLVFVDAHGQSVDDPSLTFDLEVADLSPSQASLLVEGEEARRTLKPDTGYLSFGGVVLSVASVAGINATGELDVLPVVGGTAVPGSGVLLAIPSIHFVIEACPLGQGLQTEFDSGSPLRCQLCPPGTIGPKPHSLELCDLCPDSAFAVGFGRATCLLCPANAVRDPSLPGGGLVVANTTASSNGTTATTTAEIPPCVCLPGYWAPGGTTETACEACPEGGVCDGGTSAPYAAPGYYPSPTQEGVFLTCPVAEACVGGSPFECAAGYEGRLCAGCAGGYYALNERCHKCDNVQTSVLVILAVLGCLALIAAILAFNLRRSMAYRFAAVMIGLNSLQISTMYGQLELEWDRFADAWFDVISVFSLNIELTSPECSTSGSVDVWMLKWWLMVLLPLFFAAGFVLVSGVLWLVKSLFVASHKWTAVTPGSLVDAAMRGVYQCLVLIYLPLVATTMSYFGCRKETDGSWSLAADASRACFDASYWAMFVPALIFAVGYGLGIPSSLIGVLRKMRGDLDELVFVLKYGFLVARFRDDDYLFEAWIMARKALVVVATTLFFADKSKANAALLVLAVSFAQLLLTKPYRSQFHNTLAIAALGSCLLILIAVTFENSDMRSLFVILGIVINSLVIVGGVILDGIIIWRRESGFAQKEFFQADQSHSIDVVKGDSAMMDANMSNAMELSFVGDAAVATGPTAIVTMDSADTLSLGSGMHSGAGLSSVDVVSVSAPPPLPAARRPPRNPAAHQAPT